MYKITKIQVYKIAKLIKYKFTKCNIDKMLHGMALLGHRTCAITYLTPFLLEVLDPPLFHAINHAGLII